MLRPVVLFLLGSLAFACKGTPEGDADASSGAMTTGTPASSSSDPSTSLAPTATGEPTSTGASTSTSGTGTAGETLGTTEGPASTSEPETTTMTTGPVSGTSTGGGGGMCVELACDGKVYACGDCLDNDGDGKYDTADPECVSPCDDKEDSFATGLPGDNMDPCKQDCFFDGNSGGGPGDCAWNLKCDPLSPGGDKCPYDPNFDNCPDIQSDECVMNCQVPNGCDCFGCCSVEVDGVNYDIFLGDPDCSLADIESCETCSPNDDCDDECHPENCEVCFGQELPPGCEDPTCDVGEPCEVDDMGGSNCPGGQFCNTGCCAPITPQ